MCQILWGVIDGEINTKDAAAAILAEESSEYARALQITEDQARAQLRQQIEQAAHYHSQAKAERIIELFREP